MNIFQKDISYYTHDRYFYFKRSFFVVVMAIFLMYFYFSDVANAGNKTFYWFYLNSFLFFCIVVPGIAANSIALEQRRETLALLILANVAVQRIVCEKFLALFGLGLLYYIATLPLFAMCFFWGNIGFEQMLQCLIILISFVCIVIALGLLAACIHLSYQTQALAFILVLLWLAFTSGFSLLAERTWLIGDGQAFSFLFAMESLLEEPSWKICGICSGTHLSFSLLFLLLGANFLKNYNVVAPDSRISHKRNTIITNPIFWHDYYKVYGGVKIAIVKFFVTFPLAFVLWYFLYSYFWTYGITFNFTSICICQCFIAASFLIFSVFSNCARSFVREKKHRNFDFLMLSSLSNYEIVMGKCRAIFCNSIPFLLVLVLTLVPLVYQFPHQFLRNSLYIFVAVTNMIAIFSCALFLSLKTKSSGTASIYTYIIFAVSHSIGSLFSKFLMQIHSIDATAMKIFYGGVGSAYIIVTILFLRWTNRSLRA